VDQPYPEDSVLGLAKQRAREFWLQAAKAGPRRPPVEETASGNGKGDDQPGS
jgi:hypothetical protein